MHIDEWPKGCHVSPSNFLLFSSVCAYPVDMSYILFGNCWSFARYPFLERRGKKLPFLVSSFLNAHCFIYCLG